MKLKVVTVPSVLEQMILGTPIRESRPIESRMIAREEFAELDNAKADALAPVSGRRCRGCGASPHRASSGDVWHIVHSAAWCHECFIEEFAPQA